MIKSKKKDFQKKKKSTFEKFIWRTGEEYRFFIWDKNIHKIFVGILILLVVLLSLLTYTQNNLIQHMKYKSSSFYSEDVTSQLIALEDFVNETGMTSGAISDMAVYFESLEYDVTLGAGILQAVKEECDDDNICSQTVYRYNQKKGLYIDMYTVE